MKGKQIQAGHTYALRSRQAAVEVLAVRVVYHDLTHRDGGISPTYMSLCRALGGQKLFEENHSAVGFATPERDAEIPAPTTPWDHVQVGEVLLRESTGKPAKVLQVFGAPILRDGEPTFVIGEPYEWTTPRKNMYRSVCLHVEGEYGTYFQWPWEISGRVPQNPGLGSETPSV